MSATAVNFSKAPIPLVREPFKDDKSMVYKAKLTDPDMKNIVCEITHFNCGTTEEWIVAYSAFAQSCVWQANKNRFTLARVFLKGDALSKFNEICTEKDFTGEKETVENFEIVIKALTDLLMPSNAFREQRNYMLHGCRKPANMKIRDYINRLNTLNNYLASFPPDFSDKQKFDSRDICDIIHYGMPQSWKNRFITSTGFKNLTVQSLLDFGESMESLEGQMTVSKIPRKVIAFKKPVNSFVKYGVPTKTTYSKVTGTPGKKKWCPYHKTNSHSMEECVVCQKLATSASESRDKKNEASSPTKFDRNKLDYQSFLMYKKFMALQGKKQTMMMIQEEPEEPHIEELSDESAEELKDAPDNEEEDTDFNDLMCDFEDGDMNDE